MIRTHAVFASIALGASALFTLSGCAAPGTGIGVHNNPPVIMPAEYAQRDIAKVIDDNGATADIVLEDVGFTGKPTASGEYLDLSVKWQITATSDKPFQVVVGASGYGYGTLDSFIKTPFATAGGPNAKPIADPSTLLRDVALTKGESTEGWVEYHVPDTGKPVALTWSSATDRSNMLAFWETTRAQ